MGNTGQEFTDTITAAVGSLATRDDRKVAGVCTRPGCASPPSASSFLCEWHRRKHIEYQERSLEQRVERWRRKKRCLRCGATRVPDRKHCAKCLVEMGVHRKHRRVRVEKQHETKADRIAANTSVDNDGRTRYRGKGSRGQPKRTTVDRKDLEYVLDAIYSAIDELVHSDRVDGKSEKQQHTKAMTSFVHLASRFCDDVLARHGEI